MAAILLSVFEIERGRTSGDFYYGHRKRYFEGYAKSVVSARFNRPKEAEQDLACDCSKKSLKTMGESCRTKPGTVGTGFYYSTAPLRSDAMDKKPIPVMIVGDEESILIS